MQFAVPQFTDVEDKLIGPLTLKQFFILLGTGGLVTFFWSLFGISIFFFLFSLPVAALGLALAFGRFNGRPLFGYIGSFISFFSKPQVRIFRREENVVMMKMESKKPAITSKSPVLEEPAESRLKKLAYLLDKKTEEEKELINRKIQGQ